MPPRKEPKETVVYAASKRKPPPFKPQRPSKVPRSSTFDSTSSRPQPAPKRPIARTASASYAQRSKATTLDSVRSTHDDAEDEENPTERSRRNLDDEGIVHSQSSSSSFDLPIDPRHAPSRVPPPSGKDPPSRVAQSLLSTGDLSPSDSPPTRPSAPLLSQSDSIPTIPQPLLVRLLHEHFVDKTTQIDKHAIEVLQKYMEIFVREAIARTALRKQEEADPTANAVELNDLAQIDLSWLELEDLEKVAASMLLDF